MKVAWLFVASLFLISIIAVPILLTENSNQGSSADKSFFVGVTFGSQNVNDGMRLIDKVKGYTNLFVVDSWDISGAYNETALTEICDYAVHANLNVIVYFRFIFYNVTSSIGNVYNASTWDAYGATPWHIAWLNKARERWGDRFLGVYLYDEPGGNQIDRGYWGGNNITFSGNPVRTFENVSGYDDAANRFVTSINQSRSMQLITNTSIPNGINRKMPTFTSDYALYWFDYKAGYDVVFAELGGTRGENSKVQQISMCKGAAEAQNKNWGAIITWATNSTPYLESGQDMLQDMTMAHDAGATYVIVFNYPMINGNIYGALTDEHFQALKEFWNNINTSQRSTSGKAALVAFVLPKDYGWGMRYLEDKIWGFWPADDLSPVIWNKMNQLISTYGLKLDIIYDDLPRSFELNYPRIYYWNATIS